MTQHKIGVIGYGVWGTHHLQDYMLRLDGVEIAAVHAHDRWGFHQYGDDPVSAARKYAQEKNCSYCEDWESVVRAPEIGILSVMVCPAMKLEPVLAGLACDKSIIMDKPMALTVQDARLMVEAEARSKGVGFVLCGWQNSRACERLKEIIGDGRLGEIKHIGVRLYFTGGIFPGFKPTRRYRQEVPGGELTVIGTHAIQTLLALAGRPVTSVFSRTGQKFYSDYAEVDYEDWAELMLCLEGGMTGDVTVARLPYKLADMDFSVNVTGTRGYACIVDDELTIWPGPESLVDNESIWDRYDRVFSRLVQAIETETSSPISFAELCEVQRVLDAAYASAHRRAPVQIAAPDAA